MTAEEAAEADLDILPETVNEGTDGDNSSAAMQAASEGVRRRAAKLEAVDGMLQSHYRIGPTMAKMFLVTTHLLYPGLNLLADNCQVGDGALASFRFLYPVTFGSKTVGSPSKQNTSSSGTNGVDEDGEDVSWEDECENGAPGTPGSTRPVTPGRDGATTGVVGVASGLDKMPVVNQSKRQALLSRLQSYLDPDTGGIASGNIDVLEPRLKPMIHWVAQEVSGVMLRKTEWWSGSCLLLVRLVV
jgi:hypothetical protein